MYKKFFLSFQLIFNECIMQDLWLPLSKRSQEFSDLVHPSLLAMALAVYKRMIILFVVALATEEITDHETGGSVVAIATFDTAVFASDICIGSYCQNWFAQANHTVIGDVFDYNYDNNYSFILVIRFETIKTATCLSQQLFMLFNTFHCVARSRVVVPHTYILGTVPSEPQSPRHWQWQVDYKHLEKGWLQRVHLCGFAGFLSLNLNSVYPDPILRHTFTSHFLL